MGIKKADTKTFLASLAIFLILAVVFSYMEYSSGRDAIVREAQSETERLLYYIEEDIENQADKLMMVARILESAPGDQEDYYLLERMEGSLDLFPPFRSVHYLDTDFIIRYSYASEEAVSLVGRDTSDYPENEPMLEKMLSNGGPVLSPVMWREFSELYSAHIWVPVMDGSELTGIISGDLDLSYTISKNAADAGLLENCLMVDIEGTEIFRSGNTSDYPLAITNEIMGHPWTAAVNVEMGIPLSAPYLLGLFFALLIALFYYRTSIEHNKNKGLTESLLQEQAEKELILNNLSEQVAFLDPEMRIIWANSKVMERHTFSTDEYKGQKCYEVYHQYSEPCRDCPIIGVLETGEAAGGITKSPDGRYWQVSGIPVHDDSRNLIGVLDTALDITDLMLSKEVLEESEQRYQEILETIKDGFYEVDLCGKIIDCNRAATSMLGFAEKEIVGMSYKALCKDINAVYREFNRAFENGVTNFSVVIEMFHKNGSIVSADLSVSLIYNKEGSIVGFRGLGRDITQQKEAEKIMQARLDLMLFANSNSLSAVLQRTLDEVCAITDSQIGFYHFVTPDEKRLTLKAWSTDTLNHFCKMGDKSGMQYEINKAGVWVDCLYERKPVIHNDYQSLSHRRGLPEDHAVVSRELVVPIMREDKIVAILGVGNKKQDYTEKDIRIVTYFADIAWEIAERKKAEENIYELSFRDQLTGLYNRRYFENELERLSQSRDHPIAVISADLDGLKLINDILGHAEGDRYLQAGAETLRNALRGSDVLSRVGGDEFAVILPGTSQEAGEKLVERINYLVDQYNRSEAGMPLGISIGLAVSNESGYSLEETYKKADNAMYSDKLKQGKSARLEIVKSLLSSLYKRGDMGEGILEEVQELAIMLGQALELEDGRIADLQLFAQVYDLGKASLPEHIIRSCQHNRLDDLSEAEREAIYRHPETGYRIASSSPELAGIADLILKHHESWDGSGYPYGLKAVEIPIECRIISIVTAYSALLNSGSKEKRASKKDALLELKKCAGKEYDPKLVETFVQIVTGS